MRTNRATTTGSTMDVTGRRVAASLTATTSAGGFDCRIILCGDDDEEIRAGLVLRLKKAHPLPPLSSSGTEVSALHYLAQ